MQTNVTSHIKKGLLIAAIMIVLNLLQSYTGLKNAYWFSFVPSLFLITANILNVNHFANQLKGDLSFGNAFAFGFKTASVVAIIMLGYTLLALTVLFPELKQQAYEQAVKTLEEQGNRMPEEARIQAKKNIDQSYLLVGTSMALVSTLIVGTVGAVMGALICKKNMPTHSNQS